MVGDTKVVTRVNAGWISDRLEMARGLLDELDCSCVVISGNETVTTCHRRGVIDLYQLLVDSPDKLRDAVIADKVVGKGAAAIMALGKIAAVHSRVMSRAAVDLLRQEGIPATCDTLTAAIINRAGNGPCPVEALCADISAPADCLPEIAAFLRSRNLLPAGNVIKHD